MFTIDLKDYPEIAKYVGAYIAATTKDAAAVVLANLVRREVITKALADELLSKGVQE